MLLATLPATPVQLAHACYRFGFHIVVPASWGDELVAHAVLEDLRERDRGPVIQCTCPLVSARLLANGQHLAPSMVQTASPPVAAARYVRHALSPRHVRITYIGACPGAQHAAIDQRYMPDEFLRALDERDIAISDMPTVFDSVLPPDRRRFESLPGGCPTQEALWRTSDGRMLREVTQPTFSTDLAQTLVWREYVMIDVAPSLGCACAGSYSRIGTRYGRVAVMALEPPRATEPVVTFQPELVAATVEAPVEPEQLNGDAPHPPPPPAPQPPPSREETRETEDAGRHVSRVRVRTPSSAPLPRAYLAKRRHLATIAREPAPHVETLSETAFAEEPREAAAEAAPPPNEERDVALPIAVHVEPPLPSVEEPAAGPTTATLPIEESAEPVAVPAPRAEELDTAATLSAPTSFVAPPPPTPSTETVGAAVGPIVAVAEPPATTSRAAEEARETVEEWELPTVLATEEPADSFAPRAGPLRVEVEIYEETAAPEAEVVIPDAVLGDELKPSSPAPEIVTRPVSHWGDLLIALWLVLVASAVIASLLWRR